MTPNHFVLARIGLGCFNEHWYRRAVDVFESVTFSSLASQDSQDFRFLIVIDAAMQDTPRRQLESIVAGQPNFYLVDIDVTRLTSMRLGGHDWIYQPCREFMIRHGLITDPSEYIVTSAIDADDAWRRDHVSLVNTIMAGNVDRLRNSEETRNKSHVRHSAGLGLTFPTGLKWFPYTNHAVPMQESFTSMSVSVLARFSSGVSAWSSRHMMWPQLLEILSFERMDHATKNPMWLHVRHDLTTRPWDIRHLGRKNEIARADVQRAFGLNLEKFDRCYSFRDLADPKQHEWRPSMYQYARIFKLSGLNYQIECLEKEQAARPVRADKLTHLIERQKAERDSLIAEVRKAGVSEYS